MSVGKDEASPDSSARGPSQESATEMMIESLPISPSGQPEERSSKAGRALKATIPTLLLAGGIGALDYLRQRFQHSQTFLPERYPNGIWEPRGFGIPAEDVWFRASDGTRLHGWWIPLRRARGTALYCHGNAGNITNRIGVYRFLKRARLNVFAFDYRGYGRSEGRPTESGLFIDARAAHDHLTREIGESPERIVLFGHSLGGAVAIDCACNRPVAGLVAQSTFTDLREMARARFPRLPLHVITRNQFRSLAKVRDLRMPKLFIHGTADETIPISLGEKLFEQAAEPKEWYVVPHAGHNDVYRFGGIRYLWRLVRFCKASLRQAKSAATAARNSPG